MSMKTSKLSSSTMDSRPRVMQECTKSWIDVPHVENIEEDFYGRDVITYTCENCGNQHKAYIVVLR